jgi:P-type E1-E2 ATPase
MLQIDIPGRDMLALEYLVLDVNGTILFDGALLDGVRDSLALLGTVLHLVIVTADTRGNADSVASGLQIEVRIIDAGREAEQKLALVESLGADRVVAVGNGANDAGMLRAAAIGVCVLGPEGAASSALVESDVLASSIDDALGLLANPERLIATLRN